MNKKKTIFLGSAILLVILFAGAAMFTANQPDNHRSRLQKMELPPDGLALYHTLMQEIPEVFSQIPCACCGDMLSDCYQGSCPPS